MDGDKPYSYLTSNKIDWAKRVSGDLEERYSLHRHQWMVPQGKAYRTSLDETYTTGWVTVYEDWLTISPARRAMGLRGRSLDAARGSRARRFYAWRPIDVAYRVENQCDLLYYFMQSTSLHAAAAFEVPGQSRRAGRAYQGALFGG